MGLAVVLGERIGPYFLYGEAIESGFGPFWSVRPTELLWNFRILAGYNSQYT